MATKNTTTAIAKTDAKIPEVVQGAANLPAPINPKATALAKQDVPEYLQNAGNEGKENITKDDMLLPRLALAQKMSFEIDPEHAKFINGLELGQLFNSVTQEIYGAGPLEFIVLRADAPRHVEFYPRESGGGVKDMDIPQNDPRTQFTRDAVSGASIPPIATKFYDYVVMLLPSFEIIGLSFKSTGIKVARQMNTFIKQRPGPIYAGKYRIHSESFTNKKGTFKVYVVKNSDIPSEYSATKPDGSLMPGWIHPDVLGDVKKYFDEFKAKRIIIDVDTAGADVAEDESFNTAQM